MSSKRKREPGSAQKKVVARPSVTPLWKVPVLRTGFQEHPWTPTHAVAVPPEDYTRMMAAYKKRGQLDDYLLYDFDAVPWRIHQVAWEPASGRRHVLLESVGFGNHIGVKDAGVFGVNGNWLLIDSDPTCCGFDGVLLMMVNTYRLLMEDWLETSPAPQNQFWHKLFAPADIEVLAAFLSACKHKASDGELIVCSPLLREDWQDLEARNSLCATLRSLISDECIRASLTAIEIAKELDTALLTKRRNCKHSQTKLKALRALEAEAARQMQASFGNRDLRVFLEGLLPESFADKPFTYNDFKSQAFIDHMKIVRGETDA